MAPTDPVVRLLAPGDAEHWDEFVRGHPQGTFFHLSAWARVFANALGHEPHYLLAERGGHVDGVLPLVRVQSRLFGSRLASLPFCAYGGVVAGSAESAAALEHAAIEEARRSRVEYLELRNREQRHPEWATEDLYVTFRKPIAADSDTNMKAIPRKQRAMVRKGIDAGLVGVVDDSIGRFFDCYSVSLRNLGTPVLGKRYFALLRETFGESCEILTIEKDGRPISSVMSFYFRDEVLPYYGGGTDDARKFKANDFMYWELMRRAGERGIRLFDFGRSKRGSGSFSFKTHWGFEPAPLSYEYYLLKREALPSLNPNNPKYQLAVAAWKRLPIGVTRILGPRLARSLG